MMQLSSARRGFRVVLLFLLLHGFHQPAAQQPRVAAGMPSKQARTAESGGQLDINTASVEELRSLPGMGEAYARRVVQGRPYTAKNQLLTRGVLPQAAYQRIRDLIVAHHAH